MTGGGGGGGSAQAVANVIYSLGKYDITVSKCLGRIVQKSCCCLTLHFDFVSSVTPPFFSSIYLYFLYYPLNSSLPSIHSPSASSYSPHILSRPLSLCLRLHLRLLLLGFTGISGATWEEFPPRVQTALMDALVEFGPELTSQELSNLCYGSVLHQI